MPETIRTYRTREELNTLSSEWAKIATHPFSHPSLLLRLCDADEQVIHPIAVVVHGDSDEILAMAVGRVERSRALKSLAYLPIRGPLVHQLVIAHGGFMGSHRAQKARVLLEALEQELSSGTADILELPVSDVDDPVSRALNDSPTTRYRTALHSDGVRWSLPIPRDFDTYLKSLGRSTRSTVRNNINRFRREFEGRFEFTYVTSGNSSSDEIEHYFQDSLLVEDQSYHRGLGWGVSDTPRERSVLEASIVEGWLASAMLKVDGAPVAFAGGLRLGDVVYGTNTAFIPNLTNLPVGTILFLETIQLLCTRNEIQEWDFGPGDAEYKRRLGCIRSKTQQKTLFGPGVRNRLLKGQLSARHHVNNCVKHVLAKTGLSNRLRKALRNRARG